MDTIRLSKLILLGFILCASFHISCSTKSPKERSIELWKKRIDDNIATDITKIVLIGVACEDKVGAAICTDDGMLYYIDSLPSWDKKIYKKRIIVSGLLYIAKELGSSDDPEAIEQTVGIYWIRNPKWELDSIQ